MLQYSQEYVDRITASFFFVAANPDIFNMTGMEIIHDEYCKAVVMAIISEVCQ